MIDPAVLHRTVVELLDSLDERPPSQLEGDSAVVAAGIVVIISDDEGTVSRTWCSDLEQYRQVGLFATALDVLQNGSRVSE